MRISAARSDAQAGFTLIELLIVLAIMAVLIAVALPALGRGQTGMRQRQVVAQLRAQLMAARREALGGGVARTVDVTTVAADASYLPELAGRQDGIVFQPDGSTSGGIVALAKRPVLRLDWLTGEVSDAR